MNTEIEFLIQKYTVARKNHARLYVESRDSWRVPAIRGGIARAHEEMVEAKLALMDRTSGNFIAALNMLLSAQDRFDEEASLL